MCWGRGARGGAKLKKKKCFERKWIKTTKKVHSVSGFVRSDLVNEERRKRESKSWRGKGGLAMVEREDRSESRVVGNWIDSGVRETGTFGRLNCHRFSIK